MHLHGFIADTTQAAIDTFYAPYASVMTQLGRERGWPAMTRGQFDRLRAPDGALAVGDPHAVTEKLLSVIDLLGLDRLLLHLSVGTMPHADVLRAIELLGTVVAPAVRTELARRSAAPERAPAA